VGETPVISHKDYTGSADEGQQKSNQELLYRDTRWSHCCVAAWLLWSTTAVRQLVTLEVTGRTQPSHRHRLHKGK